MENSKMVMSVEEMARELGISRSLAYGLANTTGFPALRLGKRTVIPRAELNKWVLQNMGKGGKKND